MHHSVNQLHSSATYWWSDVVGWGGRERRFKARHLVRVPRSTCARARARIRGARACACTRMHTRTRACIRARPMQPGPVRAQSRCLACSSTTREVLCSSSSVFGVRPLSAGRLGSLGAWQRAGGGARMARHGMAWHVACGTRHVACGMWHVACGRGVCVCVGGGGGGLMPLQPSPRMVWFMRQDRGMPWRGSVCVSALGFHLRGSHCQGPQQQGARKARPQCRA